MRTSSFLGGSTVISSRVRGFPASHATAVGHQEISWVLGEALDNERTSLASDGLAKGGGAVSSRSRRQ